jgi:hypothetical protein
VAEVTTGWLDVIVEVSGNLDGIGRLVEHLPWFYDQDPPQDGERLVVEATLSHEDALVVLELPDGLGTFGAPTEETYRSAASQVELALMARQEHYVVLHAGVVVVHDRAILIPGKSMAGKSTLVQALSDVGAAYFSDEYALLLPDGRVAPYPRPLTMRVDDGTARRRVLPDRSASATSEPVPVGLVAHLTWSDAGWEVAPLRATGVVMSMLANCVNAQGDPARVLAALTAAAASATALTGTRGDAADAARRLLALMDHVP